MSKWSSFEKQQLLTENWRKYLNEEEIDEGFADRLKQTAKGAYKGGKEAWEKSRPKVMSDYPATEIATIVKTISDLGKKANIPVDTAKIVDEFEEMLKAQNFVIKEQKLELGADLKLDLGKAPTLKAFMVDLAKKDKSLLTPLMRALSNGSFNVGEEYKSSAATPPAAEEPSEKPTSKTNFDKETGVPTAKTTDSEPAFGAQAGADLSKVFKSKNDDETEKPAAEEPPSPPDVEEPDAPAEEPPSSPAAEEPDAPAVEEPKDFVRSKLKEAGVEEGKIKAFLNDLKKMGVINEIDKKAFKKAFKVNDSEYIKLLEDHPEVTKAILAMRPRSGGTEFLEAIAKIVVKEKPTRAKRTAKKATQKAKPTSNKKTKAAAKEPEPEAAKPEQTPDLRFTRRTVGRIKNEFNKLETVKKLQFDELKKVIEKISGVESVKKQEFGKNSLVVVTLTNGEQFGLPKELQRDKLEFAFKESEEASNPKASALDKVIKLAKIKDGEIEEKGIVKYGTALKESLILTWKQIAGIK